MTTGTTIRTTCKLAIWLWVWPAVLPGAEPLSPQDPSTLTEEEARRPAWQWTREQILAKGWTPYDCALGSEGPMRAPEPGGRRWPRNDPGPARAGTCITFSFMPAGVAMEAGEGFNTWPLPPVGSAAAVAAATGTWEAVADIHFTLVADGGGPWNAGGAAGSNGNIRIGASPIPLAGVLAHGYYPPPNGVSAAGDIHFNNAFVWSTVLPVPPGAFDIETVALHELGHALGLDHLGTVPADVMFPAYTGVKRAFPPGSADVGFITGIYGPPGHVAECAGACCFGPRTCATLSAAACASANPPGNFRGVGSQCPTQGVQTAQHGNVTVVHWVNPAINCFNITPEPAPAHDSGELLRGSSNCCSTHQFPGCDTPTCQQQVCQIDPSCCEIEWHPICAKFAQQHCGTLCEGGGEGCQPGPSLDAWVTSEEDTQPTCNQFGAGPTPPIPPGFFGPGSQPFFGQVCYQGQPLGATPFGDFAVADTVVHRPAGDPFDRCAIPGAKIDIPIEIVALNLVSIQPITVNFMGPPFQQQYHVRLNLSDAGPSPTGQMTVRKTHCNGGTWDSVLPVQAKFTFTNAINPGDVRVLDTSLFGFPPDILMVQPGHNAPWVSDLDPNFHIDSPYCTDFHPGIEDPSQSQTCDCNGNLQRDECDIEQGISPDCQPNGIPDECDPDSDGDGFPDGCDNCPDHPNGDQLDSDGDGIGNVCACTTYPYGDIDHTFVLDVDDILIELLCFANSGGPECGYADLEPCGGDGDYDVDDILAVLDAFTGNPTCPDPCVP